MQKYQLLATTWREENGCTGKAGVVIFFDGEVQGWCNELRDPQHWQPGCIAVDEDGRGWVAVGGTNYMGADSWQPVQ